MERGGPVQWLDEGGLLVPLVAAAQVGATYALAGRSPHVGLLALAGSGTFLAYHLDRALRIPTEDLVNRPDRVRWIRDHAGFRWGTPAAAMAVSLWALTTVTMQVALLGAAVGLLGTIHAWPLPGRRRVKDLPKLKPWLVSLVWAAGAVLLPIVEMLDTPGAEAVRMPLVPGVAVLFLARTAFVYANVTLCDLIDRPGDVVSAGPEGASVADPAMVARRAAWMALGASSLTAALVVTAVLTGAPGWLQALLALDAVGPLVMARAARSASGDLSSVTSFRLDLIAGWPALTMLFGTALVLAT